MKLNVRLKLILLSICLTCLVIAVCLLAASAVDLSTGNKGMFSEYADREFRQLIEPAVLDEGFQLLCTSHKYQWDETICILAINNTRYTLRFPNAALGMRAFQFRQDLGTWEQIPLPEKIFSDPGPFEMYPKPTEPYGQPYILRAQEIVTTESRRIRFLAVGVSDSQEFIAAYVDVEISGMPENDAQCE